MGVGQIFGQPSLFPFPFRLCQYFGISLRAQRALLLLSVFPPFPLCLRTQMTLSRKLWPFLSWYRLDARVLVVSIEMRGISPIDTPDVDLSATQDWGVLY